MKFSQLVNLRNQLNAMSSQPSRAAADLELDQIAYLINTQPELFGPVGQDLLTKQIGIQQTFDQYEQCLSQLKSLIKAQTEAEEKHWFQDSYNLYEKLYETSEYILNRRPDIAPDIENLYKYRIMKYADWHYSAMIIRPGTESFINDMVAYDPLYLIDEKHELLTPALNMFNKVYQRRLRTYVVNERTDEEILGKLPNDQFGMCLAYNYFNYRPFEVLKKYLIEIYQKLKPGGILIMTFNDCDRVSAVKLVESKFCSYTPGYLVRELAERVGYEIEFSWNDPGPSTWIEFKKPGNLDSLKGGQALAKIMMDEEILFENDKKLAVELGIAGSTGMPADKLRQLIVQVQQFESDKKLAVELGVSGVEHMTQDELREIIIKQQQFESDKKLAVELGVSGVEHMTQDELRQLIVPMQQFEDNKRLAVAFGIDRVEHMTQDELQEIISNQQQFESDKKLAIAFGIDGFERMTPEELQQVIIERSPFEDDKRLAAQHGITVPPDMTPEELRHILSSKIVVIR